MTDRSRSRADLANLPFMRVLYYTNIRKRLAFSFRQSCHDHILTITINILTVGDMVNNNSRGIVGEAGAPLRRVWRGRPQITSSHSSPTGQ